MTTQLDADLLTIAEAARTLRVSPITIHRWIRDGRLRSYKVGPRAVRIHRNDVQAMITPAHRNQMETPIASRSNQIHTSLDTIRPLTEEERQRALALVEEMKASTAEMRARRGGQPLAPSWPIIREAREERSKQI